LVSGGVFELFLLFLWFCHFLCLLLALRIFLLLDDLLELFLAFDLLVVPHLILDSKFNLRAFVLSMDSSRGRLRNQVVSTLVLL
jgi:hypothetical protein